MRLEKMPPGVDSMMLYDISLARRRSDEETLRTHPTLWRRVARGNVLLRIRYLNGAADQVRFVLQGLRKFAAYAPVPSGFLHDTGPYPESDCPRGSDDYACRVCQARPRAKGPHWPAFFVGGAAALDRVETYVATEKENGEAAHFSVIEINTDRLYVVGSKNVHMLIRDLDDVRRYEGQARRLFPAGYETGDGDAAGAATDRFVYAKRIASALMRLLFSADRGPLMEMMLRHSLTANFELIDPGSRHFVYYHDVAQAELRFLAWTTFATDPFTQGLTRPPLSSLRFAEANGLKTAQYRVYGRDVFDTMLGDNRWRRNSEGLVTYCCDAQGRTLGLWKIKTIWYSMHKCIRNHLGLGKESGSTLEAKIGDHGRKLALSPTDIRRWQTIGLEFRAWLRQHSPASLSPDTLRSQYASLFAEYERDNSVLPL